MDGRILFQVWSGCALRYPIDCPRLQCMYNSSWTLISLITTRDASGV
jgi:hypothetical protein